MKKITLFINCCIIVAFTYNCNFSAKTKSYKELIIGNWAYYHNQDYVEVYFDASSCTFKSEILGERPYMYKIFNDTIWFEKNPFKISFIDYNVLFLIPTEIIDTLKLHRLNIIDSYHSNLAYSIRKVCYLMNSSIITPDSALSYFRGMYQQDTTIETETLFVVPRRSKVKPTSVDQ